MTDITTLSTATPKKEVKRNQFLGLFEDTIELIAGGRGSFVNEGPVTGTSLEQLNQMPEHRTGMPVKGELRNFNEISPQIRMQGLRQELSQPHLSILNQGTAEEKRARMNELLGFDPSYKATVDNQGNSREYYEGEAERVLNSQMTEKQLKASRESLKSQALGKGNTVNESLNQKKIFEAGTVLSSISSAG